MYIFRRQVFRILARLLVVSVVLGNTTVVWASVDAALADNGRSSAACLHHQQSDDQQYGSGNCCQESGAGDCGEYCNNTCTGMFTSAVPQFSDRLSANLPSNTKFLPNTMTLSEGVDIGQLHRPPIFSV